MTQDKIENLALDGDLYAVQEVINQLQMVRDEIAHIKEVEFPRKAQAVADGWRGKVERLEEEAEALRLDAERYRWLRAQHWSDNTVCVVTHPKDSVKLGRFCPSGDMLDDVIDKRRGETDEQG